MYLKLWILIFLVFSVQLPNRNEISAKPNPPTKTVIIMDYPSHKDKNGTPYLQSIQKAISNLPSISIKQEPTGDNWNKENAIRSLNPALIIIHLNCFPHEGGDTKMWSFCKNLVDKDCKFLFYSGARAIRNWRVDSMITNNTGLDKRRFETFATTGEDTETRFPDSTIVEKLRNTVKRILEIN